MIVMAIIIVLLALFLFAAERLAKHTRKMDSLSLRDALVIGVAQAFAIFPGVSRSGSTITAGLGVQLEREAAARFSFLLSAPIIAGAGLKSLWDIYKQVQAGGGFSHAEWILFPIGVLAAAISGFFCIRYLLLYLRRHSTDLFVYYRWGLAALIVLVAVLRG
jgi:undecaprenyl-diphosphatase